MLKEGFPGVGLVVLRRDRQHHAALSQGQGHALDAEESLTGAVALAQDDALDAVIADDPAPERIVQVEDQAASALAAHGGGEARGVLGVDRQAGPGEGQLGHVPLHRRMPGRKTDGLGQGRYVEQHVAAVEAGGESSVEALHQPAHGAGDLPVEAAEQGFGRRRQGLHHAAGAAGLAHALPDGGDQGQGVGHRLLRVRDIDLARTQRQAPIVERDQHRIAAGPVERRVRRHRLLHRGAIGYGHALQIQAMTGAAGHKSRPDQVQGAIADHPELERRQRGQGSTLVAQSGDGGRQPAELGFIQPPPGQVAHGRAAGLVPFQQGRAGRPEILGRGEPSQAPIEILSAHRAPPLQTPDCKSRPARPTGRGRPSR